MSKTVLVTKLHIPSPRPKMVLHLRLTERLNGGLTAGHKLMLFFVAAGFEKPGW
jgi:LuxR family maltose regulon positive regulatory protein